ncbi:MAG: YdhR family protein [Chloroflexota bacterium]
MIVQYVKFKSDLSDKEVRRVMEERAPQYRATPGLIQKYYVRDPETGEYGGIYIWDSEESLRAFRQSELSRTISTVYRVTSPAQVETLEVVFPLRGEASEGKAKESAA